MATQVQFRRGTTVQTNAFAGAVGEVTVDTDKKTVVVHDGSTAGGFPAKRDYVSSADRLVGRVSAGSGPTEEITCTAAGRALLDDADASTQRITLGLGSLATLNTPDFGAQNVTTTGSVSDGSGNLRTIPQNAKTSTYVLIASDSGKHISITTGGVTVPAGIFSIGDAVSIYNNSASGQTITQGASATLRWAGTALTGNRTLGQYGLCTILCVASNTFVISGTGVT